MTSWSNLVTELVLCDPQVPRSLNDRLTESKEILLHFEKPNTIGTLKDFFPKIGGILHSYI